MGDVRRGINLGCGLMLSVVVAVFLFIFALMVIAAIVLPSHLEDATRNTTPNETAPEIPKADADQPPEKIDAETTEEVSPISIVVNRYGWWKGIHKQPAQGNAYMALDVTFTNGSKKNVFVSPLEFTLRDPEGREFSGTYVGLEPSIPDRNVTPGEFVRGNLCFEVPTDISGGTLSYTGGGYRDAPQKVEVW